MGDYSFKFLQRIFSLVWRCELLDKKNIPARGPAVFVSNHHGSYAPIATLAAFPMRLYPWVEHQTTDWKLCPDYLRKDFVEKELHLKPPLSKMMAWFISKACIVLMKVIQAIPVYEKSMKLATTWRQSIKHLKREESLIMFPENDAVPLNDVINKFDQGFVGLAPVYFEKTGRILDFVPVAAHKTEKVIKIGQPIAYDPKNTFSAERERIATALQDRITEMYFSLGSSLADSGVRSSGSKLLITQN
jgi:1-acyl-sn-glycerol-3-phosphate acyltransferase